MYRYIFFHFFSLKNKTKINNLSQKTLKKKTPLNSRWGSNPQPHNSEADALPLNHYYSRLQVAFSNAISVMITDTFATCSKRQGKIVSTCIIIDGVHSILRDISQYSLTAVWSNVRVYAPRTRSRGLRIDPGLNNFYYFFFLINK